MSDFELIRRRLDQQLAQPPRLQIEAARISPFAKPYKNNEPTTNH